MTREGSASSTMSVGISIISPAILSVPVGDSASRSIAAGSRPAAGRDAPAVTLMRPTRRIEAFGARGRCRIVENGSSTSASAAPCAA